MADADETEILSPSEDESPPADQGQASLDIETSDEPAPDPEAAVPDGEATETPNPLAFLDTADDTLIDRLFENDKISAKLRSRIEVARNNAVSRTKAEQRREMGRRERVGQALTQMMQRYGVDPQSVEPNDLQQAMGLAAANREYELRDVLEQFPKFILNAYEIPATVHEAALQAQLETENPERYDDYLKTLIAGAVESELAKYKTQLQKDNETWRRTELEAMVRERQVAAPAVPATPRGNGARATAPSPSEYYAASTSQRREWAKQGVEVDFSIVN